MEFEDAIGIGIVFSLDSQIEISSLNLNRVSDEAKELKEAFRKRKNSK